MTRNDYENEIAKWRKTASFLFGQIEKLETENNQLHNELSHRSKEIAELIEQKEQMIDTAKIMQKLAQYYKDNRIVFEQSIKEIDC